MGPRAAWLLGMALIVNFGIIVLMYKELTLSSFDKSFAQVTGLPTRGVHLAYMTGVALATVAAFESVGAILVVAFLIVPPAAGRLVSKTVHGMIGASVAIAVLSALIGLAIAAGLDTSIAGSMAAGSGVLFGLSTLRSHLTPP